MKLQTSWCVLKTITKTHHDVMVNAIMKKKAENNVGLNCNGNIGLTGLRVWSDISDHFSKGRDT